MTSDDMTNQEFILVLRTLDPHPPISKDYGGWGAGKKGHYQSEKDHMIEWFRYQKTTGTGAYTRTTPNNSARVTYERLLNHRSLIWIIEAIGENTKVVRAAVKAANEVKDYRTKCKVIRSVVPWSRIMELAKGK